MLTNLHGLLPLLQRLDALIEGALSTSQSVLGTNATNRPKQELVVDGAEADRLLDCEPGAPTFARDERAESTIPHISIPPGSCLAQLQQLFELSEFDLDVLAIALAPELDRRYDRLYAYLQDDVRCKRPTVDLALNLLCESALERLERRIHFTSTAPLIHHQLLHLLPDPHPPSRSTLLAYELHLDEQVVRFLLRQPGLDRQLLAFCQWVQPGLALDEMGLSDDLHHQLLQRVEQEQQDDRPLRLYFEGSDRPRQRQTAEALADAIQVPLLMADLARLVAAKGDFNALLKRLFREVQFQPALLYIEGLEALRGESAIAYDDLLKELEQHPGSVILAGEQPWKPVAKFVLGFVTIPLAMPTFAQIKDYWQRYLAVADIPLESADVETLASRFRLTETQIVDAIATACNTSRGWGTVVPTLTDLFAAARTQAGHDLGSLARKIEPKYTWEDIVLPVDSLAQLQEICQQAQHQQIVYETWGFGSKLSLGRGLNVLFSGLPGTGKTMAAEVIANELQLDLYKIDLSQIVSKYIGETEKNLNQIFTAAAHSNAILLFDEADALFGKRSEVRDAHDRYANIEVGYLLQKMEEYEGIAILTTNLRSSIDDAFVRRLRFIVDFPMPNERDRLRLWQHVFPSALPVGTDLDVPFLAQRLEITGASIRNIALAAAFLAASDGGCVTMQHIIRATQREFQKVGKLWMHEWGDRTKA